MGRFVEFSKSATETVGPGVTKSEISGTEGKNMKAEMFKLDAGAKVSGTVPGGCDHYFFFMSGEGKLAEGSGAAQPMSFGSFGILEEGRSYTLTADKAAQVLSVTAPPPGQKKHHPGFKGGLKVVSMHKEPVDRVPEKLKERVYLVTKETAGSDRGHGMIVKYVPGTETTLHCHPDADSLFVFLEGKTECTVLGKPHIGEFGKASFYPAGEIHSLHGTAGGSNFLEFHIPGEYTTKR
jgi:quercetin dioxygenase-like cupin family protein